MCEKERNSIQEDSLEEVTGGHSPSDANRKNCWFGNWSTDPNAKSTYSAYFDE